MPPTKEKKGEGLFIRLLGRAFEEVDDEHLSKAEVSELLEKLISKLEEVDKNLASRIQAAIDDLSERHSTERGASETEYGSFKEELLSEVRALLPNLEKKVAELDEKMAGVRDGKDADPNEVAKIAVSLLPKPKTKPELTGAQIAERLEALPNRSKLKLAAIEGLADALEKLKKAGRTLVGGMSGVQSIVAGSGVTVDNSNTLFPVISVESVSQVWMPPETPQGDIDGTNTTYYLTYKPVEYSGRIVINKQTYVELDDWTIVDNVITMLEPLPLDLVEDAEGNPIPYSFRFLGQYEGPAPELPPYDGAAIASEEGSIITTEDDVVLLLEE